MTPDEMSELSKNANSIPSNQVCEVCGGRAKTCFLLGHRPPEDRDIQWQSDINPPEAKESAKEQVNDQVNQSNR